MARERFGRRGAARRAAFLVTCVALLSLATAAFAHHGQPATGEEEFGEANGVDTESSPVAKDGEQAGWEVVGGAKWQEDGTITQMASPRPGEPSPTPYDLDFYGVDFLDREIARQALLEAGVSEETVVDGKAGKLAKTNGFAVGAQCRRSDPSQPLPPDQVAGCDRIPVIYRYRDDFERGLIWEGSYRGSDRDDPGGFVAAVAWLGPDRALAVGGTGTYPRRESERKPDESDDAYADRDAQCLDVGRGPKPGQCEGAGMARAWLFENGSWAEITDLPEKMRALHTVDASFRPPFDCPEGVTSECAIAGGMAQLWHFADGEFTEGVGPELNGGQGIENPSAFRFRVREVRFFPNFRFLSSWGTGIEGVRQPIPDDAPADVMAAAVTSGCCGAGGAARLTLDATGWHASPESASPESPYALYLRRSQCSIQNSNCDPPPYVNDGYSVSALLLTAGGPSERYGGSEPASRFNSQNSTFSTLRLVAMDGDSHRSCSNYSWDPPGPGHYERCQFTGGDNPDGIPDWAVGVLRSSSQGIAYTTDITRAGSGILVPLNSCTTGDDELVKDSETSVCSPEGYQRENASKSLFKLGTYALNAYRVAGEDLQDPGVGWAVGDHGAIATLAGGGGANSDPPARRGAPEETRELSGAGAYAGHRPPEPAEPGLVPAYGLPSTERLAEPRFSETQTPLAGGGEFESIVMSRGGSEGWAFGASIPNVFHYESGTWSRCDAYGVEGVLPPDPACAALAGKPAGAAFRGAAARVPLEHDSDPTNDDEFEVVAFAGNWLLRYSEGRWRVEEAPVLANNPDWDPTGRVGVQSPLPRAALLVFTAPDDGWAVNDGWVGGGRPVVYRFDGERWWDCSQQTAETRRACDDLDSRIDMIQHEEIPPEEPTGGGFDRNPRGLQFAAAGDRVYAYGTRAPSSDAHTLLSFPYILYRDAGEPCDQPGDPGCWRGGEDTTDDGTYNPTDGGYDPGYYLASGESGRERIVEPPKTGNFRVDPVLDQAASTLDSLATGEDPSTYQGRVWSVAVATGADGELSGWAVGQFKGLNDDAEAVMMRLTPEEGWQLWARGDAADEYLGRMRPSGALDPQQQLTLPPEVGARNAFITRSGQPALAFNQEAGIEGRWEVLATPWTPKTRLVGGPISGTEGDPQAMGADGEGGFWAIQFDGATGPPSFHHYTAGPPAPVFEEAPHPAGDSLITTMDANAQGTLWLGDEDGRLHRYDRVTGWEGPIAIPGWDAKRSTVRSGISDVAVGPDGSGLAVGPGGRIAQIGPERIRLDPFARGVCEGDAPPPCGTGRDLLTAEVAPDGSALITGEQRTILWRPPDGGLRHVTPPPVSRASELRVGSMPRPDRAYLIAGFGSNECCDVFAGELTDGEWSWELEIEHGDPRTNVLVQEGKLSPQPQQIRDVAIDASGRGYAVGAGGVVLARSPDGEWRRLPDDGVRGHLASVALPEGGGEGALFGGTGGLVLTAIRDEPEVVRPVDLLDPVIGTATRGIGAVREMALVPGVRAGQVEAWVLVRAPDRGTLGARSPEPQALLHYASDPTEPLLDPAKGLAALPDAPGPRPGELSFAALGKQDCQIVGRAGTGTNQAAQFAETPCPPSNGSNLATDLLARRTVDELASGGAGEAPPEFALFTGDAVDSAGAGDGWSLYPDTEVPGFATTSTAGTQLDRDAKHRRWIELFADPLTREGVPLFGAVGVGDLAREARDCGVLGRTLWHFKSDTCMDTRFGEKQLSGGAGPNLAWRQTMATMPAPWLRIGEEGGTGPLSFAPVAAGPLSQRAPDQETPGLSTGAAPAGRSSEAHVTIAPQTTGGAPTHYAVDVYRGGEKVARIVAVDTSLRSLAASDAIQQPAEAGGQARWLEEVLCFEGSAENANNAAHDCTREQDQQAIVVSNTPTYSYGPISPEELQADAAAFEAILLRHRANVVVSGRLGWNGRYWALAPGLHSPCPGQAYRADTDAPRPGEVEVCGAGTGSELPDPNQSAGELAGALGKASPELGEQVREAAGQAGQSALPFVVSSTAGGRFNVRAENSGQVSAEAGFWRGYAIVRLDASGDPRKTIVEQRPLLDWVGLSTSDPVLEPRRTLQLQSFAREAFGVETTPRYYAIPQTQAITHRYHLLLADPEEPWRACAATDSSCTALQAKLSAPPRAQSGAGAAAGSAEPQAFVAAAATGADEDLCEPYLCLPERVGTIDPDTGEVRAGGGKYPDTFAVATLSVAEHVATKPLVFTRSPSFVVNPLRLAPGAPLATANATGSPNVPDPPQVPQPNVPQPSVPQVPSLPGVPPLQAAQPPEPQPPAPPAPPPPAEQPSPLDLTVSPTALTVATPAAVIQPPTPPVNPAPPSGARREARQRQAATQKSGADIADEGMSDVRNLGGDPANAPDSPDQRMTRRDRTKPEPSFTAIARADQPSAWPQGFLYTGALTLMAAALAAGWSRSRPTPRQREPRLPAPAYSELRRRRL